MDGLVVLQWNGLWLFIGHMVADNGRNRQGDFKSV
jgi:hypothetical protein